ncbi:MAG: hypothetical protein OXF24_02535 [Hyphomicrobiales bacterium]|nr:hypothetical protein [Hyphomicrobiales bacterium]MCY4048446.1 hypothetical protein [Hyphomicrobiales bacterium]MCY4052964.1 hypothetical protein [Hyphomicrobiales bacterium]
MISYMEKIDAAFVGELFKAYEYLFDLDDSEKEPFIELSASMRRVFTRWKRPILLLEKGKVWRKVLPASGGKIVAAKESDICLHGPYCSEAAYRKAVKEAEEEFSKG